MQKFPGNMALSVVLGILACALPIYALASNGLYMTGIGNESVLMGGADVAVARDAYAAINNPSGMTQLPGQALDINLDPYYSPDHSHTDSFGNYRRHISNQFGLYGSAAYARRLDNSPYAAGVALVVQGGLGFTYSGLNTIFGTRDDASGLLGIIKLAPAVAWKGNNQLSLGAALGINYISSTQEVFPNTSTTNFSGFRFKDASGIGVNSKWGLQYRPAKDVTIGVTYGTQTGVPIKGAR